MKTESFVSVSIYYRVLTRNTGYEVKQAKDSLDYLPEAEGGTTKQIALDMMVSRRRVQQIWSEYVNTGRQPAIGENMGRPKKPYEEREAQIVSQAYAICRFGARMFEPEECV